MAKDKSAAIDADVIEPAVPVVAAPGTVLKPFLGPTRRFAAGYVVGDADARDLPLSLEDLKAGGFLA